MISTNTMVLAGCAALGVLVVQLELRVNRLEEVAVVTSDSVGVIASHVINIEKQLVQNSKHADTYREIVDTQYRIKYTEHDLQCLAKNIYYEAGVENDLGKYAVGTVTLNRLKTQYWGRSVCSVVYAKAQFSWTKTRVPKPNRQLWAKSVQIAKHILNGKRVRALDHSLFYHADYIDPPEWVDQSKQICQIGAHIFYTKAKHSTISI